MIIGLTGTYASGKDTVADYLEEKEFVYHSCSDIIREYCRKIGQETSRENLIQMGNKLREKYGDGYLAKKILQKINKNKEKKSLVLSIRHPAEVKELKKDPFFVLIVVDAPLKARFMRTRKRQGRPEDRDSFEEFKRHEEQERKGRGASQQLDKVVKMADCKIINDGTLEELDKKIEGVLRRINAKSKKDRQREKSTSQLG